MNGFDAAYLAALAGASPVLAYKRLRYGKYKDSLPGMFGKRLPDRPLPRAREHRCWMHSVSVGETIAASAVHGAFAERVPGWEFLVTTTTETGQAEARRRLAGARTFAYAPADFTWTVDAFLRAYRPTVYCVFETELWPNLLGRLRRGGTPAFLVNGKLSEKSARGYARLSCLFRPALAAFHHAFMQTDQDAERLARVRGSDAGISVTGNVKFDALPRPLSAGERATFRRSWGVADDALVVLAGSTHPGEERTVLEAFNVAVQQSGTEDAVLVIAPRHPERFSEAAREIARAGASAVRTSTGEATTRKTGDGAVVLLDEMGVLARAFGAADIALVGGAWNPIGGHNLLEPAAHGIPVLHGPHMHSQPDIMRIVAPSGGVVSCTEPELGAELASLMSDAGRRTEMGAKAAEAAGAQRGAAHRVVDAVLASLS